MKTTILTISCFFALSASADQTRFLREVGRASGFSESMACSSAKRDAEQSLERACRLARHGASSWLRGVFHSSCSCRSSSPQRFDCSVDSQATCTIRDR